MLRPAFAVLPATRRRGFHGNTAAMLKLTTGSHVIVLKFPGRADWSRTLEVLKFSKTSLKGTLDPAP